MSGPDLVDLMLAPPPERFESYPLAPGDTGRDTSVEAAEAMRPTAALLRDRVLDRVRGAGQDGMTADECATALGESVLAVRPRFSELAALGRIVDSEQRRANLSGRRAIVWRARAPTVSSTEESDK